MDMFPPTLHEQITCVTREIKMRESVYPRWVGAKKISQDKAEREIAQMKAVLETLKIVACGGVTREDVE